MGFAEDLQKICDRTGETARDFVAEVAFNAGRSIIKMAPVDSGRFRGNWQFGDGEINLSTSSPVDKSGEAAIARIKAGLAAWDGKSTIYITNSLPYAQKLEYGLYGNPTGSANGPKTAGGYSKQTPGGMVRLTVQRINTIIQKEAAKVK